MEVLAGTGALAGSRSRGTGRPWQAFGIDGPSEPLAMGASV
ncbi:hypothetical protein RBY4I_3237 [Rhodobacterales bacterium Y4I]|nr:hypothetical protein RBY4I_3237 [Rhodobacterales bacterium Y4I]